MSRKTVLIIIFVFLSFLTSCGKLRKTGTYEGKGQGRNGEIKVSVTINSNGEIENIEVLEHEENKEFIEASFSKIRNKMIEQNTYDIDVISGATDTSKGLIEAVKNAVDQSN